MSLKVPALFLICVALLFPACTKKTEAEIAEEERDRLREEKRVLSIQSYTEFIKAYPDDPRAEEARQKIAALEAAGKKK